MITTNTKYVSASTGMVNLTGDITSAMVLNLIINLSKSDKNITYEHDGKSAHAIEDKGIMSMIGLSETDLYRALGILMCKGLVRRYNRFELSDNQSYIAYDINQRMIEKLIA